MSINFIKIQYWLLFLLSISNISFSQVKERPNIIFILTDDQRYDALGYAGNPLVYTPEMDKLAKSGTYFKNAIATTPICAASRASILTGLYERTHKYNFQTASVREEYMNLSYPKLLKEAGYYVGFYGKYGTKYDNKDKIFDVYDDYDRNNAFADKRGYFYKKIGNDTVHLTRYTGQQALDFIDKRDASKPFCLSLSFSAPHAHDKATEQYFSQEETNYLLENTTIPKAKLSEDKYFNQLPLSVRNGFNRLRWTWRFDNPEKYQKMVKGYYRMIFGIDLEIAKIREKLKEKNLDKNTVIIVMGDNGYFLGERQLADKWLMYDLSIKVPLIIYDPRNTIHQDVDDMALNVDIASTIADLANVKQPKSWQGKSLLPLVTDESKTIDRDTILIEHIWEINEIPPSEGVRTKEWKYFRYVNDKSLEELYNLQKDPQEINNLAKNPKYKSVLEKLKLKCNQLIKVNSDSFGNGPTGLTIELIRQPKDVGILDAKPEYGWIVPNTAVSQSCYQILVSSSIGKSDKNIGDVWNSGQVRETKSNNIEHKGGILEVGKTYFWKVRIWDEDNYLSNYSESQTFKMENTQDYISTANKFQKEEIKPKAVQKIGKNYLLDFGKDAFATLEFNYTAQKAHTLTFHMGEELIDGKVNRKPIGHIRYQEIKVEVTPGTNTYQVPIKVDTRNTLPNKAVALPKEFPVLMPFRYAEIENLQGEMIQSNFTQIAFFNYWENNQSDFKSDNTILNQVWDLCKYSIKATTFAGLYVDGDRERIPYEADAYLNQLSHYTTDREYAIGRRTIEYFMEHPTWPTEWQQHMALLFHADYMYTGNTELIAKYYEELKHKTLIELSREDGLISSTKATPEFMKKLGFKDPKETLRDITDWPPAGWGNNPEVMGERDGFVFQPYNTVINALFYKNMKIMAEFAQILGKNSEADEFELMALKVKKAVNEKLFDKNKGIYIDGEGTEHSSIHANMMPLAFDMVAKENIPSVIKFIKSRKMACSVYGAQYLMEALYNAGEADYALQLLSDTSDRSWYNMIKVGSTITMEAWDMKYKPNADWNHAWGAVPANIIPRGLWGITPKTPGFSMVSIKPQLGNLKNSSIEVPTINGIIKATYKFNNLNNQKYTIEIPANMFAEFSLKNMIEKIIVLNGKKVATNFDSIRLSPGINTIEIVVNTY